LEDFEDRLLSRTFVNFRGQATREHIWSFRGQAILEYICMFSKTGYWSRHLIYVGDRFLGRTFGVF